jgi:hypothetical protein
MEGLALGTINLLVLPILGGYWFQYKFIGTHYRAERLTPQRLVFHAAFYAFGLVVVARGLVFAADSGWQPTDSWVELFMFSVIPACVAFVLLSLAIAAGTTYWPQVKATASSAFKPIVSETRPKDPLTSGGDLLRIGFGALVGVVLLIFAARISSAMCTESSLTTEVGAIGFFALLLAISKFHHRFLNRYMDFPFFGVAMRIGLFGVIGSLAGADFLFLYPWILALWDQLVHVQGGGIPMLAFLIGLVLWWPLNLLYPYQAANMRLHEMNGTTALDRLLYRASLTLDLLSLSMKDGKVYIGYIQELPPNPEDRNSYFEILPFHSGYRDKDTREMKLTTFYESAYEQLVESQADSEAWLVFLKVLKIDDIVSAGRFDPKVYIKFRGETTQHEEQEGWDDRSG